MVGVQKRKIQWAISLLLVMLYFSGLTAQAQYGGGTGEPNDPYLIYTAEQINSIGANQDDWDKHFILMADIDLAGYTGTAFNIIGYWVDWWSPDSKPFTGVFDGSGHTISNFSYTSTDANGIGLFGYVSGENAQVKDLGLIDPNIDAGTREYVASLVGYVGYRSVITNCYAQGGSVSGSGGWPGVGGLVGHNWEGTITNCYSTASVSGDSHVGGLVGGNVNGTITNCYSSGDVEGVYNVGGLVGLNGAYLIGYGTITNCYATGSVSGNENVGGLVGRNSEGTITNCYSSGSVTGDEDVGGLVGRNWFQDWWGEGLLYGIVSASFWDIENSGQITSGGGTGKTTAEMQMASTFISWGCEPVWTIDEGKDYPRLWWENKPGDALPVLSEFLPGSGTEVDPYLIYTPEQLNVIGVFLCESSKHFKLMADIDLSEFAGTNFNIIGTYYHPFTGVLDGNGKIISNFSYTSTGTNRIGLFAYVSSGAVIKDLGLIDPNIDAVTGHFVGSFGSLVGRLGEGTITNCYVEGGSVSGDYYVGGLVGRNDGTITDCYSITSVSGDAPVGGLVGWNLSTITSCYSSGSVTGDRSVGGLMGWNSGTITNCYATGSVAGNEKVGGLVGAGRGAITNCYSIGGVTGTTNIGGLIGSKPEYGTLTVTDSFWDMETSGQTTSAGGTGKTTAEMQTESTFTDAGWDFVAETANGTEDIWWILEGQDYPRLTWELVGN